MPTEQRTGIPLLSKNDARNMLWSNVDSIVSKLAAYVNGRYLDAHDRDTRSNNPDRGEEAFLSSPGVKQIFDGARWRRLPPGVEVDRLAYIQGAYATDATGPHVYDLGTKVFNRDEPYLVLATASLRPDLTVGAHALWINQAGASPIITWASTETKGTNVGVSCTAFIPMPIGGQLTMHPSVNLAASSSLFVYNDYRHSCLQTVCMPMGMVL